MSLRSVRLSLFATFLSVAVPPIAVTACRGGEENQSTTKGAHSSMGGAGSGGAFAADSGGFASSAGGRLGGDSGTAGKDSDGATNEGGSTGAGGGDGGYKADASSDAGIIDVPPRSPVDTNADGGDASQRDAAACPTLKCSNVCPMGLVLDAVGCKTCLCKPDANECLPSQCVGPQPVEIGICPANTARTTICKRSASSNCTWTRDCEPIAASCAVAQDPTACGLKPLCRWVNVGCLDGFRPPNKLKTGCYDSVAVGCVPEQAGSCGPEKTCIRDYIDPCEPESGGGLLVSSPPKPRPGCYSCNVPIGICL